MYLDAGRFCWVNVARTSGERGLCASSGEETQHRHHLGRRVLRSGDKQGVLVPHGRTAAAAGNRNPRAETRMVAVKY